MAKSNEEKIDEFKELIQPLMEYCATCQPYDDGDVVWMLGARMDLEEILDEHDVPDELRDDLAKNLECKYCGRTLCRFDKIGLKTAEEKETDKKWAEWHEKYEWRIEEFGKFLEKYPYLGLHHEIGKQFYDTISEFPKTNIKNEEWWRARKITDSKIILTEHMYPPKFPTSEGRFNHYGQGVFYLASSREAAMKEALERDECIAWVQQFKISEVLNLLDLESHIYGDEELPILALGLNSKLVSIMPEKESPWKPEYFIPRFIADCAKDKGFNGIIFNSPKHYDRNLVLFNWNKDNIVPIGEPLHLELTEFRFKRKPNSESSIV